MTERDFWECVVLTAKELGIDFDKVAKIDFWNNLAFEVTERMGGLCIGCGGSCSGLGLFNPTPDSNIKHRRFVYLKCDDCSYDTCEKQIYNRDN